MTVRTLLDSGALETVTVQRRARQFLGRRVSVRRNGRVVRIWRPVRVRKRIPIVFNGRVHWAFQRVRRYRWVMRSARAVRSGDPRLHETITPRAGCMTLIRGRKYRRVFLAAEPAIRSADPGAQVLAGETSPHLGLDVFARAVLPLNADGWAHHPYQWDVTPDRPDAAGYGIGRTGAVAAVVGMPLYFTEFGYPREEPAAAPSTIYTDEAVARALPRAWAVARAHGVRQMLQYGWYSPAGGRPGAWNTSILRHDDGTTTPVFDALAGWLRAQAPGPGA